MAKSGLAVSFKAKGLTEFRKQVKSVDRELGKSFRQAWLAVARMMESRTRGAAPASARGSIKGRATQRAAFVRITPRRGDELARFMGQKRRSGWFSALRYRGSAGRQFKPWVGNQWDPGEQSGKPYFIGDTLNDAADEAMELLGQEIDQRLGWFTQMTGGS